MLSCNLLRDAIVYEFEEWRVFDRIWNEVEV